MSRRILAAALAAFVASAVAPATQSMRAASMPIIDHVFVIVMENHSYNEIIGSPSAPYINSLVAEGGLATNYYAVTHPSLPNYLALTAGSTLGVTSDCTSCWQSAANIADMVENAGMSWKGTWSRCLRRATSATAIRTRRSTTPSSTSTTSGTIRPAAAATSSRTRS